jgi:hypothetical protein
MYYPPTSHTRQPLWACYKMKTDRIALIMGPCFLVGIFACLLIIFVGYVEAQRDNSEYVNVL